MKYIKWLKSEKSENASVLLCICEKFKASILFHMTSFLGFESGWAFYRSQFFGGNRCNEPLKLFFD